MINVEAEVNKHKNCKDRDELGRQIKNYKNLALQHAANLIEAGSYNMIIAKLQEIYDKLPAPNLKHAIINTAAPAKKTANITKEEQAKINEAWKNQVKGNR